MDRDKDTPTQVDRRSLLKGAGLALGAAGVAVPAVKTVAAAPAAPQAAGYAETDHVRTYYMLARF